VTERRAAAVRNSILAALLATEYKRLLPKLEHVTLRRGERHRAAGRAVAARPQLRIASAP